MPHPSLRRGRPIQRFDHGEPIRAIDTRPMVFVTLFIAVVFLLAASQTRTHALLVDLPQPEAGLHRTGHQPFVHRVELTASGQLRFDGEDVNAQQLESLLLQGSTLEPRAVLAFEPDGAASYDLAAQTLAIIHRAGVNDDWFCIDGMEKHGKFGLSGGHPLPLLTTIPLDDETMSAQPIMPMLDIDTCAPELFGISGR
jgi:biopolymer transport protein ExbD